jgi:hypothetical protein
MRATRNRGHHARLAPVGSVGRRTGLSRIWVFCLAPPEKTRPAGQPYENQTQIRGQDARPYFSAEFAFRMLQSLNATARPPRTTVGITVASP